MWCHYRWFLCHFIWSLALFCICLFRLALLSIVPSLSLLFLRGNLGTNCFRRICHCHINGFFLCIGLTIKRRSDELAIFRRAQRRAQSNSFILRVIIVVRRLLKLVHAYINDSQRMLEFGIALIFIVCSYFIDARIETFHHVIRRKGKKRLLDRPHAQQVGDPGSAVDVPHLLLMLVPPEDLDFERVGNCLVSFHYIQQLAFGFVFERGP
mmetsp:Transcript_19008/g.40708  ORF Transcript_19008/g.40708 Transcript_19008/m.40708 type:complete len:210 (-) Transcript_19008:173-802(-)